MFWDEKNRLLIYKNPLPARLFSTALVFHTKVVIIDKNPNRNKTRREIKIGRELKRFQNDDVGGLAKGVIKNVDVFFFFFFYKWRIKEVTLMENKEFEKKNESKDDFNRRGTKMSV